MFIFPSNVHHPESGWEFFGVGFLLFFVWLVGFLNVLSKTQQITE